MPRLTRQQYTDNKKVYDNYFAQGPEAEKIQEAHTKFKTALSNIKEVFRTVTLNHRYPDEAEQKFIDELENHRTNFRSFEWDDEFPKNQNDFDKVLSTVESIGNFLKQPAANGPVAQ